MTVSMIVWLCPVCLKSGCVVMFLCHRQFMQHQVYGSEVPVTPVL